MKNKIFFLIVFFSSYAYNYGNNIKNGYLDLNSLPNSKIIELKGDWEFYWKQFYSLEEIRQKTNKEYCYVPHNWIPCNSEYSGQGYATYYLKIKIPEGWLNKEMGLYIPTIGTSYKIYINGILKEEVGKISSSKSEQIPLYGNRIIFWEAKQIEQEILIYVSNYYHKSGGLWYNLSFGLRKDIEYLFYKNLFFDLSLFGAIMIMAFFHLGLFLQKFLVSSDQESPIENQSNYIGIFYFSLFCFLISIRVLFVNNYIIYRLIPESYLNWFLFVRIEYWTHILGLLVITMFFISNYEHYLNSYIKWITIIGTSYFFLETIFGNTIVFTTHLIYYQIFMLLIATYLTYLVFINARKKVPGALESFLGGLILYFTVINDILHARSTIQTAFLTTFGLFCFILFHSFMISRIFEVSYFSIKSFLKNLRKENLLLKRFFPENLIKLIEVEIEKFPLKKVEKEIVIVEIVVVNPDINKEIDNYIFLNENLNEILNLSHQYNGILERYDNQCLTFLFPTKEFDLKDYLNILFLNLEHLKRKNFEFFCIIHIDDVIFEPLEIKDHLTYKIIIKNQKLIDKILVFIKSLQINFAITEPVIEMFRLFHQYEEIRYIENIKFDSKNISIYELYTNRLEIDRKLIMLFQKEYMDAINAYKKKNYLNALEIFRNIYLKSNENLLYLYYLNKIFLDIKDSYILGETSFKLQENYFKYEIGNPLIDLHHQFLFRIILLINNYTHQKNEFKPDIMEIKKIIDFILIVAKIHFLTEEYLMKSMKYLQLEEHQKEHHSFLITLEYFKEQLNQKDWQQIQNTIEKLSNYLSKWLVEHISYADLNGYARFLKEKDKKLFSNWLDI